MQHLGELRNRVMVASLAVLITTVIGFTFAKDVILWLELPAHLGDRKSTRLNSSHQIISYAVFCLKKKKEPIIIDARLASAIHGVKVGVPTVILYTTCK